MDGSPADGLGLLVLLLGVSAFLAASEAAYLAISRSRVRQMKEQRLFGAGLLSLLHHNRSVALTALLLGITLSNYMAERVATLLSVQYVGHQAGPVVAVVIMTIVIIAFCEVVPIQFGASRPERTARWASVLIVPLAVFLMPLVLALFLVSRAVLYLVGVRTGSLLPGISEEHLKAMIVQSEEQGLLEKGEREMMHGALDFGDRTVAQLMTPRPDMVCVEARNTLAEALRLGLEHNHSRLPVYDETPDNVVGILHLKDLLPYLLKGEMDGEVRVVARPAHHVPESLPADELLAQLQRRHALLAVVKDEYGGTAGLVTVEDLLEEIVGEIRDEYDVEEPDIVEVGEHELLCEARVPLHDLEEHVRQDLPTEEYDSLGGLILDLAQHIPVEGEVFRWGTLEFRVETLNGPRLERIRVRVVPAVPRRAPAEEASEDG